MAGTPDGAWHRMTMLGCMLLGAVRQTVQQQQRLFTQVVVVAWAAILWPAGGQLERPGYQVGMLLMGTIIRHLTALAL